MYNPLNYFEILAWTRKGKKDYKIILWENCCASPHLRIGPLVLRYLSFKKFNVYKSKFYKNLSAKYFKLKDLHFDMLAPSTLGRLFFKKKNIYLNAYFY